MAPLVAVLPNAARLLRAVMVVRVLTFSCADTQFFTHDKSSSGWPGQRRVASSPHWSMPSAAMPNVSLPAAGLKVLSNASHYTIFAPSHKLCCTTAVPPCDRQPECMGTYNHAPLVTAIASPGLDSSSSTTTGSSSSSSSSSITSSTSSTTTTNNNSSSTTSTTSMLVVAWHNCPFDEDSPGGRALYSHSIDDGATWTPAKIMFDALPGSEGHGVRRGGITAGSALAANKADNSSNLIDTRPFCVLDTASGNYYIKTGGERSIACGWDGGEAKDKCCRSKPGNCRWLNKTTCEAALPEAADPSSHFCLPCKPGVIDSGCPRGNWTPGPPPPPPVPAIGINGTNIYMKYAVASGFVGVTSATCRLSEQHGACGPSAGCCSRGLGCCKCLRRMKLPSMMRQVAVDRTSGALILGKPFWASKLSAFPWAPRSSYLTLFEDMDKQSQADAVQLGTARLLDVLPQAPAPRVWSERSVTWQKQTETTAQLALLTRDDGTPSSLRMWASECELHLPTKELQRMRRQYANGELLVSGAGPASQCNWTAPVETNIPDSRSKTCAGTLPSNQANGGPKVFNGTRYLLGNQLPKIWDRDPLTISLSQDGVDFNCVMAVRARCLDGAHCPGPGHEFFPGFGKGPGYQYPSAAIVGENLMIVYSVAKEEIALSRVPLSQLVCTQS